MKLPIFPVVVSFLLVAGCRAPMPSFNIMAPFGPTRVPPPGTGSYGTPDDYIPKPRANVEAKPASGGASSRGSTSTRSGLSANSDLPNKPEGQVWQDPERKLTRRDADPDIEIGSGVKHANYEENAKPPAPRRLTNVDDAIEITSLAPASPRIRLPNRLRSDLEASPSLPPPGTRAIERNESSLDTTLSPGGWKPKKSS